MSNPALPPLNQLDPAVAWQPWRPDEKNPWTLKWAAHLYRRAGFGATSAHLLATVGQGFQATLDRLFQGEPGSARARSGLTREGDTVAPLNDPFALRAWWLDRMLTGGHPLREKLTLFWHDHFATSIIKVQGTALMHGQNELIRRHALGKFGPFLLEMSKDPAMLVWLDSNSNVAGKPNENYAREIMELFSLGVGNYTEKDIREAARAFTGWHTQGNRFTFMERPARQGREDRPGPDRQLERRRHRAHCPGARFGRTVPGPQTVSLLHQRTGCPARRPDPAAGR